MLPKTTPLQFIVLVNLFAGAKSGRELRFILSGAGEKKSGPAFYQLMGRLEEDDLVVGNYEDGMVAGQEVKERHYTITAKGRQALNDTQEFYNRLCGQLARDARMQKKAGIAT